jgi:hypothetical protein
VNIGSTYCDIDDGTDILYFKKLDKFLTENEVVIIENEVVKEQKEVADVEKDNNNNNNNNNNTDNGVDNVDNHTSMNHLHCSDDQLRSFRDLCPLSRTLIRSIPMLK